MVKISLKANLYWSLWNKSANHNLTKMLNNNRAQVIEIYELIYIQHIPVNKETN